MLFLDDAQYVKSNQHSHSTMGSRSSSRAPSRPHPPWNSSGGTPALAPCMPSPGPCVLLWCACLWSVPRALAAPWGRTAALAPSAVALDRTSWVAPGPGSAPCPAAPRHSQDTSGPCQSPRSCRGCAHRELAGGCCSRGAATAQAASERWTRAARDRAPLSLTPGF